MARAVQSVLILVLVLSVINMQTYGVAAGRMLLDEDDTKPAKPVSPNTNKMTAQTQFDRMPTGKKPAASKPSVKDPGHSHDDGHNHDDD